MFKRVDHVEIISADAERMLNFYVDVLNFKVKSRTPLEIPPMKEIIFIELGDTVIEIISVNDVTPRSNKPWQVSYRAIALEVDDMNSTIEFLKEKNIEIIQQPVDLGDSYRGEIVDPDGLIIELRQWKN